MGWLDTVEYEYRYKCAEGHVSVFEQHDCDRQPRRCIECGESAEYDGFNPLHLLLRGKVAYEKNGRKAFRITDGNGNVRHVSATKEHYMETGDIKPSYTPGYAKALKETGREDLLAAQSRDEIIASRKEASKAKVEIARKMKKAKDAHAKQS